MPYIPGYVPMPDGTIKSPGRIGGQPIRETVVDVEKESKKPGKGTANDGVDSGFYGANDLQPKLVHKIKSTGGYPNA